MYKRHRQISAMKKAESHASTRSTSAVRPESLYMSQKEEQADLMASGEVGKGLPIILLLVQITMIVVFAAKARYGVDASPLTSSATNATPAVRDIRGYSGPTYPMFQDVHVMIFIGFGFLMTFLKRYGYGAVGFNYLLASFVIQWALICRGFAQSAMEHGISHMLSIVIDIKALYSADFVSGAVLISFGAVLGKTSPTQLIIMAFIEVILFAVNEAIGSNFFKASDIGGSIFIHTFGAYFGLAVARVLHRKDAHDNPKEGSTYHSDLFSMIGTVFLWMYWPSFNGLAAEQDSQHRAIINTYLSIASSCVVTFALSPLINGGKLNMVHVQNATLAGGVAVGATADMMIEGSGAMIIGSVAGIVSCLGFQFLTPLLASKLQLHDTCGVNNLHGMPGLMAATASIICAITATENQYGESLGRVFPMRPDRTATQQAIMQAAALGVTLGIALVGGIVTGFILKMPLLNPPESDGLFDDSACWDIPDSGFPECHSSGAEYQNNVHLDRIDARSISTRF